VTSGDPSRLPLFPLGTVLFPGVLLPLHVFEERYRRMVRDLLEEDQDRRDLGIVAIREGREVGGSRTDGLKALHPVGCVARLRRVDPYADGRFDIVCMGTSRFRLTGDGLDTSLPYLRGRTQLLDEPPGEAPGPAAGTVRALFDTYRQALGGDSAGTTDDDVPHDPRQLSYLVAATVVLDLTDRQRLLEAPDTTARLRSEIRLLRRETALLASLPSLPGVELTRVPANPN